MSAVVTFDTLRYAKKMVAVGFTQQQAEAQAEAIAEIVDERLATKQDIKELEIKLETRIRELELHMTIKLGGLMIGGLGTLVILMKLFKL